MHTLSVRTYPDCQKDLEKMGISITEKPSGGITINFPQNYTRKHTGTYSYTIYNPEGKPVLEMHRFPFHFRF